MSTPHSLSVTTVDTISVAFPSFFYRKPVVFSLRIGALQIGIVPDAMKKKISDFFNRISVSHRKAVRDAESGK